MLSSSPLPPHLEDALAEVPPDERDQLARVWDLLGDGGPDASTDAAWAALRTRVEAPARRPAADRAAARPRRRRWAVLSGAVAAVVALAAVWTLAPVTHRAAPGQTAAVTLPDGSTAVLAAGAELTHRRALGARSVALDGEAYFEVETGTPFTVETPTARVEVLGTAFNVRAWDGETAVALVHGRVRVTSGADTSELAPGQALVADGAAIEAASVDVEQAAAWRFGAFSVQDRPLGAVLGEVERRYGVAIGTAADAPLGARVSAFYAERPALDVLLGDLGAAAGARFEAAGDGYRVRAAAAPAPRAVPSAPQTTTTP